MSLPKEYDISNHKKEKALNPTLTLGLSFSTWAFGAEQFLVCGYPVQLTMFNSILTSTH